jgi:hypothetical protein
MIEVHINTSPAVHHYAYISDLRRHWFIPVNMEDIAAAAVAG